MKIIDVEQGTDDWFRERLCSVTSSKLDNVMGTSLARVQLIAELIAEEGTEQAKHFKPTAEMERGTYEEVFAIKSFEKKTGKKVTTVGICVHDQLPWLKLSPDGLIADEKGEFTEAVEVKSPDSKTATFYDLTNIIGMEELGLGSYSAVTKNNPISTFKPSAKNPFLGIPADYKWQAIDYFLVNEKLETLYFLIHDPRFIDDEKKLTIITVKRSDPLIEEAIGEAYIELAKFRGDWMKWRDRILPNNF